MIEITLEPDMSIEPGHQRLVFLANVQGYHLANLLTGNAGVSEFLHSDDGSEYWFHIPHTEIVDRKILELINALAHVRFSAPDLVQMTLEESSQ